MRSFATGKRRKPSENAAEAAKISLGLGNNLEEL
jgi:hypothetical protein